MVSSGRESNGMSPLSFGAAGMADSLKSVALALKRLELLPVEVWDELNSDCELCNWSNWEGSKDVLRSEGTSGTEGTFLMDSSGLTSRAGRDGSSSFPVARGDTGGSLTDARGEN